MPHAAEHLRTIRTFDDLVRYLEEKLDWPLQEYGFDELTFSYEPEEVGLKEEDAAKVRVIYQLRPLNHGQPWGIFFVEFEKKKLPVVVLRRILSHLVVKKRASANKAKEAAWHAEDLLFVTAFGNEESAQREIAFAHFHQSPGDLPTLRVLGWDGGDTPLKLSYVDKVLQERLRWPDDPSDHKAWREQWRKPFKHRVGHVIRTADALAEALAALARGINDKAKRMLAAESESGPLKKLHKAFQTALIHDLTEESFADTYAQTITYGLLTAAISRTEGSEGRHGTFIIAENVTDMVPITNPFLKEMLQTFLKVGGRKGGIDFDELGIQDVVDLLRGDETDLPAILRDFGNKTQGEDPVIHFYEHFLAAYNKKLKVQRGVFYTPQPVVSYIVRSVHELLQTEFGLEDGIASTVTWGEMAKSHTNLKIPANTTPDTPFVQILDPATGTGTFLVEIIDVIHKTMTAKWRKQGRRDAEISKLWNEYVPKHLLPRLYGYELMMAPYAIAHMKIGLKLFETGYRFMSNERVRVYLTNALEPASDEQQKLVGIVPALAHEAQAVNAVKCHKCFTVVVGNPPYAKISSNRNNAAELLVDPFKHSVRGERNIQPLSDDYVKFLGLVLTISRKVPLFAFGMITNRGYLNGLIHRGIRQVLVENFNNIWAVDLHGDSNVGEKSPDGRANENVFDIQQGVAITIGLKSPGEHLSPMFSDLWGTREEKYNLLTTLHLAKSLWTRSEPSSPNFFFQKLSEFDNATEMLFPLNEVMPTTNTGIKTHRDDLVVDFEATVLSDRISQFVDKKRDDEEVRSSFFGTDSSGRYQPGDNRDWQMTTARSILQKLGKPVGDYIKKIEYRPFDGRYIFYHSAAIDFAREDLMCHMNCGHNLGLIATRQVPNGDFCHAFVSRLFIEMKTGSHDRGTNLFPLFLYDSSQSLGLSGAIRPNFSEKFLKDISASLRLKRSGQHGLPQGISPENIVQYIYAIFHSPTYRSRYAELLKIDFPRVPLTSSLELFRSLAKLGCELVILHLLESPKVNDFITTFTGTGDNSIPKKPTWKDNAVWINPTQRFEGVPENVWNFHIGGYQVCEKWLKDRKGRTLSEDDITHYQRVVVALNETIRIMGEIDKVIDEHGGWPIK